MNEMLDIEHPTCGSPEQLGVHRDVFSLDFHDASTRLVSDQANPHSADWERWIVRINEWTENAGQEDCDGIVWPSVYAIDKAYEIVQQMRSRPYVEPSDVVPSGDGGIVFSHRTKDHREEIEISQSGDAELLVFADCHLIDRKPW